MEEEGEVEEFDEETLAAIRRADEQIDRGEGCELGDFARAFRAQNAEALGPVAD